MNNHIKVAVFIDHSQARLIACDQDRARFSETISSGKETHPRYEGERSNQSRFGSNPYHGSNNEYGRHMQAQELKKNYFHQVKDQLLSSSEIWLFGPGQAKKEMYNYLQELSTFKGKTIHVQNSDYKTDNQLLETARIFFDGKTPGCNSNNIR